MTNIDRKIQKKGWNNDPYKFSREKIEHFFATEETKKVPKKRTKSRDYCYHYRGSHQFVPETGILAGWSDEWNLSYKPRLRGKPFRFVKCSGCGKKDTERKD